MYFEPYDSEIPESDHGQLERSVAVPRLRVLDSDDVHEVEDDFHCEERNNETHRIGDSVARGYVRWSTLLSMVRLAE